MDTYGLLDSDKMASLTTPDIAARYPDGAVFVYLFCSQYCIWYTVPQTSHLAPNWSIPKVTAQACTTIHENPNIFKI